MQYDNDNDKDVYEQDDEESMFVPQANPFESGFTSVSLNPEATAFKPAFGQNNAPSALSQPSTAQQPAWNGFGSTSGSVLQPSKPAAGVDFSVPPLGSNKPFGSSFGSSTASASQPTKDGFSGFSNPNNAFNFGTSTQTAAPAKDESAKPMFGNFGTAGPATDTAATQPKAPLFGLGAISISPAGPMFGISPAATPQPALAEPSEPFSFAPKPTSTATTPAQGKHRKSCVVQSRADAVKQRKYRLEHLPSLFQLRIYHLVRNRTKKH
jgi:hypothetical protein